MDWLDLPAVQRTLKSLLQYHSSKAKLNLRKKLILVLQLAGSQFPIETGDFPSGSVSKNQPAMQETTCNAGDLGSIPGLERSPGEGNDNPLQFAWAITWTEESSELSSWDRKFQIQLGD